jgi:hypothetical protein
VAVAVWGAGVAIKYNIGRDWKRYDGKNKLSVAKVLEIVDREVHMPHAPAGDRGGLLPNDSW